jgi:hypothetical protein
MGIGLGVVAAGLVYWGIQIHQFLPFSLQPAIQAAVAAVLVGTALGLFGAAAERYWGHKIQFNRSRTRAQMSVIATLGTLTFSAFVFFAARTYMSYGGMGSRALFATLAIFVGLGLLVAGQLLALVLGLASDPPDTRGITGESKLDDRTRVHQGRTGT